jgi:hypothetical protein
MNTNSRMWQVVGAVERTSTDADNNKTTKSWWTRIGVAYENKDGSWNLKLDYVPTRLDKTTIQLRPFSPKEEEEAAE